MEKEEFRLLYYKDAEPQIFNMASILTYAAAMGEIGEIVPTLIIMEGFSRPFCYMGYYQDLDREVIYENCKKYDVEIVRRWKLGLGNIFMNKCTGGWATVVPKYERFFKDMDETYDILVGKVFFKTLKDLGVVELEFKPPNDLRTKGKKIVGTAVSILKGINYYNAFTNLTKPDPELPFKVLNIPPEKFKDKPWIKRPEDYFAAIEIDSVKGAPKPGEFKEVLVKNFEEILNVKVVEGELTSEEKTVWEKYLKILTSEDFLFRRSTSKFKEKLPENCKYGFFQEKYRKLVQASVGVTPDGVIKDVMITGDFGMAPPDLDEEIALALKGLKITEKELAVKKVEEIISKPECGITGASAEEFITPVFEAAKKALEQ